MTKSALALTVAIMMGAIGAGQATALEQASRSDGCVFVPEQGLLVCDFDGPTVPTSLSEPVDGGATKKLGILGPKLPTNLQVLTPANP